ncbi:hypothetical protein NCU02025 [Neurospora crassa OR74A]|uniref:Nup53p-like protein n=2 Tax=Neurospora crassa TaxID=5141 RepID=Q1K924_NEUCR|nr:hypothetical protein NCU02025 [Neurospora crassa OR74A]EAA35411.1 hypothetical protein NCU02025 [Neurospora crassa OR74A]CAD11792.1 putative protein [Neurospora crassa]|eukprot:XP_964647.1 hypothetical protein NCU02025 [Neurospora crassa OR74A]
MAPLILHNVPDDELYVGDDGIQRPYAMVFPHQDGPRSRRAVHETGSFGKSTRRSRSKTATPARREDATIAAADRVFSNYLANLNPDQNLTAAQRKQSLIPSSLGDENAAPTQLSNKHRPTEVILRGYRSVSHQYAAINHYEELAGRICEDYPRDPPPENRRYKSELRDPLYARRRPLTAEERALVNRVDGGEHWVKVTFDSAEAAEAAMIASPQAILGHLVFAEPYDGVPPARDEAVPDNASFISNGVTPAATNNRRASSGQQPRSRVTMTNPYTSYLDSNGNNQSPSSSRTADTGTISDTSSATITSAAMGAVAGAFTHGLDSLAHSTAGGAHHLSSVVDAQDPDSEFCRAIPTVRKAKLLPVDQALLPAPSYTQRVLNHVPLFKWFSGNMIGNEVPRKENGEFDWDRASLYWKLMWWLDARLCLFRGEVLSADKDE